MQNKEWLQKWLDDESYTREDIVHIVGKGRIFQADRPYTEEDVLRIVDPPSYVAAHNERKGL